MKLLIGVADVPYTDSKESASTGDVAEILEEKYHVMEIFYGIHQPDIISTLENGIAGAIENTIAGKKGKADIFLGAYGSIENEFHKYLDNEEMRGMIDGVPTQAALDGISSRFKKKKNNIYRKGKTVATGVRRPSFIDSGMYRQMFKVWIEQ